MPVGVEIPAAVKCAIVADRALGLGNKEIAAKYGVHRNTVYLTCKEVADTVPNSALASEIAGLREEIRIDSYYALKDGLSERPGLDYDRYKRSNLGATVLKGLGDFAGDTQVSVTTLVSSAPQGVDSIVASMREVIELEQAGDTTTPSEPAPLSGYVESLDPVKPI